MDMGQVRIFVFFHKKYCLVVQCGFLIFLKKIINLIFFMWLIFALLPQIKLKQEYVVVGSSFLFLKFGKYSFFKD
jgi:hypothetical protein